VPALARNACTCSWRPSGTAASAWWWLPQGSGKTTSSPTSPAPPRSPSPGPGATSPTASLRSFLLPAFGLDRGRGGPEAGMVDPRARHGGARGVGRQAVL